MQNLFSPHPLPLLFAPLEEAFWLQKGHAFNISRSDVRSDVQGFCREAVSLHSNFSAYLRNFLAALRFKVKDDIVFVDACASRVFSFSVGFPHLKTI
jgi:hypothetical protein